MSGGEIKDWLAAMLGFTQHLITRRSVQVVWEMETLTLASSWWSLSSTLDPKCCSNDTICKDLSHVTTEKQNKGCTKVGTSVYMPVLHFNPA